MKAAIADLICAMCVAIVLFAAVGGFVGGLDLKEVKRLASLGLLAGVVGVSLEGRRK